MPIVNYDCGDLSEVVISTNGVSGTINIVDSVGSVIGKIGMDTGNTPVTFMCSGALNIQAPLNSYNIFLSSISLQGVWSENFLMGLAGVVCGSLLAYVCVKYAV